MAPSDLDKAVMVVFDQLPHKLPTREIISLYASSRPQADFIATPGRGWSVGLYRYGGPLAAVPSTTILAAGASPCCKEKGSASEGSREGRAGPSRTASEPTAVAVGLDIAAHLRAEPAAEESEVFATIPTTKLMVETLELQSRALMASRTVVEELERVTTVTIPRLKKDVTEATQASKMSTEKARGVEGSIGGEARRRLKSARGTYKEPRGATKTRSRPGGGIKDGSG
ncbi:hypothetical protein ACSQ67_023613 [Phaseolus vulgaris]